MRCLRHLGGFYFGCGGWIWTNDLRVMSPTSYLTAPHRVIHFKYYNIIAHIEAFVNRKNKKNGFFKKSVIFTTNLDYHLILLVQIWYNYNMCLFRTYIFLYILYAVFYVFILNYCLLFYTLKACYFASIIVFYHNF